MNDINYDSKFYIFNKTFYKEQLIKIFEENIDKITTTYMANTNTSYFPSAYSTFTYEPINFNNPVYEQNQKVFEKYGISLVDLKKINESFSDNYDMVKLLFRNLKINHKVCEKIKENYNNQYGSLECVYRNISVLYEYIYDLIT